MENNDSPYIYEKPLRSKRARRASSFAAIALVGLAGTFGASSIATSIAASSAAPVTGKARGTIVTVPLQEVKPKANSVKVNLPFSPFEDTESENEYEDD